ncbi:DUF1990 domain-containing protein, partial [Brachybacterium sp.]|uniref:DUF1990 domain-containing protein n=1 Tax=Brachybacterium sp. TaxID=1891286 RepID=UPI002ED4FB88
MDTPHAPTWWEDEHASLCEMAADPSGQWTDADPPFSDALLELLAEVEAAFAVTGTDTPPWPDPHLGPDGEGRDSLEEEYSRCLDPGKYRILWSRAEAWAQVLTARGWATRVESEGADLRSGIRWATPLRLPLHRATVLRPRRPGAQALVLARTASEDAVGSSDLAGADAQILGLEIGMGEPAVPVSTVPDCGCDACDSGSRDLLETLDRTLLSIVDGSFEVELAPGWTSHRSSFGAGGGGGEEGADLSLTLTARPWAETWTPRPLSPAIDPHDPAWAEEMLAEGRATLLLDTVLDTLPPFLAARLHRLRPGRSGAAAKYVSLPLVEEPVTAPLDALDHPPAGYRREHRSTVVTGKDFDGAASALRSWAVHRRAGLQVRASHIPLREGTEVHLRPGLGPLRLTAPCRVLWLVDEPDRQGFAYGTLPGHPESGIEQFTVTRTATGLVRFHLDVVSR